MIRSAEEPIAGSVIDESGRGADFRGWIEFAAALTNLLTELPEPEARSPKEEVPDE